MMVDGISLNSVNSVDYPARPSDQITSRGADNFSDSLRATFDKALKGLRKEIIPGTDQEVYVPNPSPDATLSSLNMV